MLGREQRGGKDGGREGGREEGRRDEGRRGSPRDRRLPRPRNGPPKDASHIDWSFSDSSKEDIRAVVSKYGGLNTISWATGAARKNATLMLACVGNYPLALEFADPWAKKDLGIISLALNKNGLTVAKLLNWDPGIQGPPT